MAARILDLCDAAAAAVRAAWMPTGDDEVRRAYAPKIPLTGAEGPLLAGRKVYIFPADYGAPDMATRAEMRKTYTLAVVVVERYADAGTPPDEWVDGRVNWVEANVFRLLRYPGLVLLESPDDSGVVPDPEEGGTVDVVYHQDYLTQLKTFWSQLTLRFTEYEGV